MTASEAEFEIVDRRRRLARPDPDHGAGRRGERSADVRVIGYPENLGKGYALVEGAKRGPRRPDPLRGRRPRGAPAPAGAALRRPDRPRRRRRDRLEDAPVLDDRLPAQAPHPLDRLLLRSSACSSGCRCATRRPASSSTRPTSCAVSPAACWSSASPSTSRRSPTSTGSATGSPRRRWSSPASATSLGSATRRRDRRRLGHGAVWYRMYLRRWYDKVGPEADAKAATRRGRDGARGRPVRSHSRARRVPSARHGGKR